MSGLYQVLGLSQNATDQEIKKAYKKLAFLYHPDKTGGDLIAEEKFKEINTAYSILSNPDKRASYDFLVSQSITYEDSPKQDFSDPTVRPHPYWGYKRPYKINVEPKEKGPSTEQKALWDNTGKKLVVFFCILIVCAVIFGVQWEKQRKKAFEEERIAYFTLKMGRAFTSYQKGDFLASFREMPDDLSQGSPEAQVRDVVLRKVVLRADSLKDEGVYKQAVAIYGEILTFQLDKNILFTTEYESIKESYLQYANLYSSKEEELKVLNFLIDNGYGDLDLILEKIVIYKNDSRSTAQDLSTLYDEAVFYTIEYYEQHFGSSFYLTINPDEIPKKHYDIFYQRALLRYDLNDFKSVVEDCDWLNIIFPTHLDPYHLKYKCWRKMNKESFICQEINQFVRLTKYVDIARSLQQQYCQSK